MGVKAGGVGITLTRANHVFHFDQWWNPATTAQASARARRIGQKRPVFATSLYALGTIEERVAALLEKKRRLFSEVFDEISGEDIQKHITDEELFGLFGLSAPKKEESGKSQKPMSWQEFEKFVQELFDNMGYRLLLTPASYDGGIDLIGTRLGPSSIRVAVQCKHYQDRTVSVNEVRDFWGATTGGKFGEMWFITTGRFSKDAMKFAEGKALTLVDKDYLDVLIAQYT
jgi:hypothetical protein